MEPRVLSDKNEYPTEEVIFSHIGKYRQLWQSVFEKIHSEHPDFTEEWRYYNDWKSYLMKVKRKNHTIFWLSLLQDTFMMTFYFTDKSEKAIMDSRISDKLKEQFQCAKRWNKVRGLTVTFKSKRDVDYAMALIIVKLAA